MFASLPDRAVGFDSEFAKSVEQGLTRKGQKTLSASWLYDEVGSALFEVITLLPEYGLTRADSRLLQGASRAVIRQAGAPKLVIELGSGTGTKTRHILRAAADAVKTGAAKTQVVYRPIDISGAALSACSAVLSEIENVRVDPIEATYEHGLDRALRNRPEGENALLLFLGSTIGNFSRSEALAFLRNIRTHLLPGDSLLLGTDLLKTRETLLSAYDDPTGVTAAFNKNLLARINRELDGCFDLRQFEHEARLNEKQSRIEMHLRSTTAQSVYIGALEKTIDFRAGETIWTESSHKFKAEEIVAMGERAGWQCSRQWVDREWGFAETLFVV